MDLLLTGLSRSGSTMIGNLMTIPKKSWVICEPEGGGGYCKKRVQAQAKDLGIEITDLKKEAVYGLLDKELLRWGIKEVRASVRDRVYTQWKPKKVFICVRDARDIVISMVEFKMKLVRDKDEQRGALKGLTNQCKSLMRFLKRVPKEDIGLIYYEKLVSDPDYRNSLKRPLGWDFSGDPERWLNHYNRTNEKRGGKVISRRSRKDREKYKTLVKNAHEASKEYQERFGYI